MNISNITLNLLNKALYQLKYANITSNQWTLGGGTILKYYYNHRDSKDIDIFFRDSQLITFVSPRINDANEDSLCYYSEQANFIKLNFEIGDIDFIVSRQITNLKPNIIDILGNRIFIDHPIEIIAKKIFYRFDNITVRDLVDIAFVYSKEKDNLIQEIGLIEKINVLYNKISIADTQFEKQFSKIKYLNDGLIIRGKEIEICKQFFNNVMNKDNINQQNKN